MSRVRQGLASLSVLSYQEQQVHEHSDDHPCPSSQQIAVRLERLLEVCPCVQRKALLYSLAREYVIHLVVAECWSAAREYLNLLVL